MAENAAGVPAELGVFIPLVEKWGTISGEDQLAERLDHATGDPASIAELETFCALWTPKVQGMFDDWADRSPMTENELVARFYFTLMFIDELDLKVPAREEPDPVRRLIEQLAQSGSPRLESERVHAVRALPTYGEEARRAIGILNVVAADGSPELRIQAHYALARLGEEVTRNRAAIRMLGESDRGPEIRDQAESAITDLDRTDLEHNAHALSVFCIGNDLRQIGRLLMSTPVDALDYDGCRPMSLAVGNGNLEATALLLAHGADPNAVDRHGGTYLHSIAAVRDGVGIIELLIAYGADVNAVDAEGNTPLDIAWSYSRSANMVAIRDRGGEHGGQGELTVPPSA